MIKNIPVRNCMGKLMISYVSYVLYFGRCLVMTPVEQLQQYNIRLKTVLNELSVLEDYTDADYSDVLTDTRWVVLMLENRRESLQRRGRRL